MIGVEIALGGLCREVQSRRAFSDAFVFREKTQVCAARNRRSVRVPIDTRVGSEAVRRTRADQRRFRVMRHAGSAGLRHGHLSERRADGRTSQTPAAEIRVVKPTAG